MKGIGEFPFIDASPFVDIDGLLDLNAEICSGIAKSQHIAGIYGPGIVNSSRYGNFLHMQKEIESDPNLVKEYKWDQMNLNQKRLFCKLYKNLYSPNTSVYLKEAIDHTNLQVYLEKANDKFYTYNDNIQFFPNVQKWLESLIGDVFTQFGRTLFFVHEHDCELLTHRDGTKYRPHKNEFLWINPTGIKNFFIYDEDREEKHYVKSRCAFFNDLDMHGGEKNSTMTWTLRIDGVFTDQFRKKLNIDQFQQY
jgi:hypothetical protein